MTRAVEWWIKRASERSETAATLENGGGAGGEARCFLRVRRVVLKV